MFFISLENQTMRKTLIGMLVATSLLVSGAAASAATLNITQPLVFSTTASSQNFGATLGAAAKGLTFDEDFTFAITQPSALSASVISIALGSVAGMDITGFTLTNSTTSTVLNGTAVSAAPLSSWTLTASNLGIGNYTLAVLGTVTGTNGGSFGGNINVSPVPEASTTAMMLGGLALVGFAATRRRRNKDAAPPMGMFAA
ncbi:MAG: glycosyl transferase family 1 [Herbaspirillum sp.]|nr:glycosyl transferase family 1 [Herbaspirillum sp.]